MGEVDELNSSLGLLLAHELRPDMRDILLDVQHDLFDLGAELCLPGSAKIGSPHIRALERALGELNKSLPALQEFVLPGGAPAVAVCHLARAVCRRAERSLVALADVDVVNPEALAYLNRLSDLLFVIARTVAKVAGQGEIQWDPQRRQCNK